MFFWPIRDPGDVLLNIDGGCDVKGCMENMNNVLERNHMNVDFYTKTVLTVIAVCLVTLVLRSFEFSPVSTAHAAEQPGIVDVNVVQVDGRYITDYNALPVKVVK